MQAQLSSQWEIFFIFFEQRRVPEAPIFIHLIGSVQHVLHIPEIVKIGR
jgi:hypothetical protein